MFEIKKRGQERVFLALVDSEQQTLAVQGKTSHQRNLEERQKHHPMHFACGGRSHETQGVWIAELEQVALVEGRRGP